MTQATGILYIEDNPDNQRLVQRVLNARGYRVVLAEDGRQGLTIARAEQPALILVDLLLPGLSGYETTTRLRSLPHLAQVPIIALTADTMPGSRERALIAGCDGFLAKPIDTRLLPLQIAEFIGGKREFVPPPHENSLLREYNQSLVAHLEQRLHELSAAHSELQELDQLKSQFLSTLSHELRTPLTSLMGYLELLDRDMLGSLNEMQREATVVMRRNAAILNEQLSTLLAFQELRSNKLRRSDVRLHERIRVLLSDVAARIQQAGLRIEAQIGETATARLDMTAMDMALRQVFDNSIKFNRPAGMIRVRLNQAGAWQVLEIEDSGCGIAAEHLEKIFLPFYQVDTSLARSHSGSGLGLAIARHVIESHGGRINVQSTPGIGTCFKIELPPA
jgi:signal transduction histidine kinase